MERIFLIIGSLFAFVGVSLGAFGAHGLKGLLSTEMLQVFEVAVRYQMYHALAIIAVACVKINWPSGFINLSGWFFTAGILLFSGSLYFISLSEARWLGAITPIGGVSFLLGWACLALAAWRARSNMVKDKLDKRRTKIS